MVNTLKYKYWIYDKETCEMAGSNNKKSIEKTRKLWIKAGTNPDNIKNMSQDDVDNNNVR